MALSPTFLSLRAGGDIRPCHGHRAHLRSELVTCPASPASAIPASSSASVSGLGPPGGGRWQGGPICSSPPSSLGFTLRSLRGTRRGHQHTHSPQPGTPGCRRPGGVRTGVLGGYRGERTLPLPRPPAAETAAVTANTYGVPLHHACCVLDA